MILYVKSIHIIFVVTWFAGLFYIVRLFVYAAETQQKTKSEREVLLPQYLLMQRRLWYGITWPSAILTLIFGSWMLYLWGSMSPWLWVKIALVALLFIYQLICQLIFSEQQKSIFNWSSTQLRVWNEIATILLVSIVFIVVVKSLLSVFWAILGLAVFSALLMGAIFFYKKIREKQENKI